MRLQLFLRGYYKVHRFFQTVTFTKRANATNQQVVQSQENTQTSFSRYKTGNGSIEGVSKKEIEQLLLNKYAAIKHVKRICINSFSTSWYFRKQEVLPHKLEMTSTQIYVTYLGNDNQTHYQQYRLKKNYLGRQQYSKPQIFESNFED